MTKPGIIPATRHGLPMTIDEATLSTTTSWAEFTEADPELAVQIEWIFRTHPHHVIATVRPDGSPRVGGTNVYFTNGEMWIGMMAAAARVDDLSLEPRCAIHSAPLDEELIIGDVRLDLIAERATAPQARRFLASVNHEGEGVVFTLSIAEASLVRVDGTELVLTRWSPPDGRRVKRVQG